MVFMQVLSFFLMFISFALIGWMILTFRKVRAVSTKSPLIAMGMSMLFILVYWRIINTSLPAGALLLILLIGAGLGAWQGRNTKVWFEEGKGKAQNTVWFLVIWAVCFGFNQFLVSLGQAASLSVGIGAMCLGTGVVLGSQGNIFYRLSKMPTRTPAEVEAAGPLPPTPLSTCPSCGEGITPGQQFCEACGADLAAPEEKAAGTICPKCGAVLAPGQRFCEQCESGLEQADSGEPEAKAAETEPQQFCTNCSQPLEPGSEFCDKCGEKVG